jgi:hypothetical protein
MRFLSSFKEVYDKRAMLPRILLQDIFRLADIGEGILDLYEVDSSYMKRVSEADLPEFENYLGGDVKIVETEADLEMVTGVDHDFAHEYGRWPNIKDKPLIWDGAGFLDGEWAFVYLAWTDSGGDVYYVPKKLWEAAHMKEHVRLTNEAWDEDN